MRKYVDFLERNNLLIFYQGTRSEDLSVIKNGPAYAIAHTQSPITVIPVYHDGIERIFSKGGPKTRGLWRWLPRSIFRRPIVMFGQPIDFSECFRITETRERIRAINQRIVASIVSPALAGHRLTRAVPISQRTEHGDALVGCAQVRVAAQLGAQVTSSKTKLNSF